jgi:hypothetical protein
MNIATGRFLFYWTQSFLSVRLSIPVVVTEKAESEDVSAFYGRYSWCRYWELRWGFMHRSHLRGVILTPEDWTDSLSWPLKMGPMGCAETSLGNYHYSLRNMAGERSWHLLRGGSQKSSMMSVFGVAELVTVTLDFVNFLTAIGTPANGSEVPWK